MTAPCFVDANVLVHTQDRRDAARYRRAEDWLDSLWRTSLGRTSAQALSEFYTVATRRLRVTPDIAWVETARYFAWNPQPVDEDLLRHAREIELRYKLSWWDSMIVAAAQLQNCALLLTEDLQDGTVFGAVTARSPFTLEVSEATARYAVERQAAPVHRPRGRPRRAAEPAA
jgi:predicted nucleic acid-binding protein